MRHILEKYPRDELFQISTVDLLRISLDMLRLQERQRIALFMRKDVFGRYVSCLIYVPRDRFGTTLREQMGAILEKEIGGKIKSLTTGLDDSLFARVMFVIGVKKDPGKKLNHEKIERLLQETGQTWVERLLVALADAYKEEKYVRDLGAKYAKAFPVEYTVRYEARQAIFDIKKIEEAITKNQLTLDLYSTQEQQDNHVKLKLYNIGGPVTLADVLPKLEDMGVRAISEQPFKIVPASGPIVWIHDFLLEIPSSIKAEGLVERIKDVFEEAFIRVWQGNMESDDLNQLVFRAALSWRQICILRTYVRYLKQMRYAFGRLYVERALCENASIAKLLVTLFESRHNPKVKTKADDIEQKILDYLDDVASLDYDKILRSVLALIKATLRTNFYQKESEKHKPYISVKMSCADIPDLPEPKPYREIFVYSPDVEGVHLRGDKIARGGLRWSDRHEDYRTEILGLMKAQMVKNAVIVPMGAKGGFVVKKQTQSRDDFLKTGVDCYKTFIRGLLDITDNQKQGKIISPKDVVCHDEPDPYLVVAADKGTATFSDLANDLAKSYDFWLGDAFASGGSAGYDHKKMGITARGAWESVKHHFRHLNHDVQSKPFDVIGIGDMGGDVFGNGMLLSEHIRLVAAFNHLHIFCDPDPNTEISFIERQRLFKAVKGWDGYNKKLLSPGGAIFSRKDKSLKLTPEIMKRFGIAKQTLSPDEFIVHLLKAKTDLLWFGGIGTYIKASSETHEDVGDKANDHIRVNAKDVQAKVISEGANLGLTQKGRIEFEQTGGMINTDFIDNSGGVDSSDHEVNIKILLTEVMEDKKNKMDTKKRNKLLESMTDEVADLVLRNNQQQNLALSLVHLEAPKMLKSHEELIKALEQEAGLNRDNENLPDADEIEERLRKGKGLTRPEISVLLSYAKIDFTKKLLNSDIPDGEYSIQWLMDYFPDILQTKYKKQIKDHRLNREIVAMAMANSIMNRMGPGFLLSIQKETGASAAQIIKAYLTVRRAYGLRAFWDHLDDVCARLPASVQLSAMQETLALSRHAIQWFLVQKPDILDISKTADVYAGGVQELFKNISKAFTDEQKQSCHMRVQKYQSEGLPKDVAKDLSVMPQMTAALDIISISNAFKETLEHTTAVYFAAGNAFKIDWLRRRMSFAEYDDHWQKKAADSVIEQLNDTQAAITRSILKHAKTGKKKPQEKIEAWTSSRGNHAKSLLETLSNIEELGTLDFAMITIVGQKFRELYKA